MLQMVNFKSSSELMLFVVYCHAVFKYNFLSYHRDCTICSKNKGSYQLPSYHATDLHLRFLHMKKAGFLAIWLFFPLNFLTLNICCSQQEILPYSFTSKRCRLTYSKGS